MEDSDVQDYLGRPSNAIELIHDSRRNTVSTFNIGHKTLSPDSQDEIDENQDAEPEKINNDELNKTLDTYVKENCEKLIILGDLFSYGFNIDRDDIINRLNLMRFSGT